MRASYGGKCVERDLKMEVIVGGVGEVWRGSVYRDTPWHLRICRFCLFTVPNNIPL